MKVRTLLLIIAVPILAFYIFSGGFDLLINSAVFFNKISNKNKNAVTTTKKDEDFFGTISLDPPPEATNSATISLTGQSTGFESAEIYVNDDKIDEKDLPPDDSFVFEADNLTEGDNRVYVIAKTKDEKHQKKTDEYSILFLKNPPSLSIESPSDGQKFSKPDVEIKGTSDKNTDIKVDNQPVISGANGDFSKKIRLSTGENLVEIISQDAAGNITKTELKLIYEPDN